MSGGTSRGNRPGRRLAWILGAVAIAAVGFQGSGWADSNSDAQGGRKGEARKEAREQAKQTQTDAAKTGAAATQPVIRIVGGVKVAIDPQTGHITPLTPEEAQALAQSLDRNVSRDTDDLTVVQLPNGAFMVNLQDTFQDEAIATKDRRGKVTLHCVNTKAQADALVAGAAAESGPAGKRDATKLTPKGLEKE
ncbi:MAG TPA: hypothetical protein VFB49_09195 [Patescibacteria group bacterium]|nr:hypothetical protein [Patescibacteria group bacterium]